MNVDVDDNLREFLPWEISAVIALRDSQWLKRAPRILYPDSYVALDGKIEEGIGDAVISNGDRYLVFEVKATSKQISSEWLRRGKDGQKINPKSVAIALGNEVLKESNASQMIRSSVQGHYFAYWNPEFTPSGQPIGSIVLEPYLFGMQRKRYYDCAYAESDRDKLIEQFEKIKTRWHPGVSYRPLDANASIRFTRDEALPLTALQSGAMAFIETNASETTWDFPGLDEHQLQEYLDFLNANRADELCRVVVMSTTGEYFYYAERRSQLRNVFTPSKVVRRAVDAKSFVAKPSSSVGVAPLNPSRSSRSSRPT